jgi:group II intron reverse transcriptase/maturase
MKEPYVKGVANHDDPESCGGAREGTAEALTGARAGRVLSRENLTDQGADTVLLVEGNTSTAREASAEATLRGLETPGMQGSSGSGNREIHALPTKEVGRTGKAKAVTPVMNGAGKSDRCVVATKPANKAAEAAAESVEPRRLAEEKRSQPDTPRTQSRTSVPSGLEPVRRAASRDRKGKLTALHHHVDLERLRQSFRALKKNAAAGIDGVTWRQYATKLEENLRGLEARLKSGAYRAKASRRVYIPKADGRLRPLGIAALEDKIVQRAVVEVMNAVYETDFLGFSYGFRPGRSQHDALDALAVGISCKKVNWVLDADIRGYFDAINHEWLMKFVEHRIGDGKILRLLRKWLAAGVMEEGKWTQSEEGTPQGATVSPLLANIYLHYVLDLWVQWWRRTRAKKEVMVVRYADDFIVGFQDRGDAERFRRELEERLKKFSLELHPEKTRLLEFGRYAREHREKRGEGKPETFNFLGLTHISAKSREGGFLLRRHTMRKRMQAKLRDVKTELRRRWHDPIPAQGKWLAAVVRGYFAYHAVPTNSAALKAFRTQVLWLWMRALKRRSQKDRTTWERMGRLAKSWLPDAKILHPWPSVRFAS